MIRAVLFDLDGTLLNTSEGILEGASYAAERLGYDKLPSETMLKFVGPPIQNSFMKYYGCSEIAAQEAANVFRKYYKNRALLKASLYPDVFEVMQTLRRNGLKIAVATYKREDYAITILEHFGIADYCNAMHGADNFNSLTKADIINLCIQELDVVKDEVVLVGDTEYDAIGAEKAGISFLGVTFGFGFKTKEDVDVFSNIGSAFKITDILTILNIK